MADMIPQGTQENAVPFGHETADANVGGVVVSVVVLFSSVLVVMLAMAGMFNYLNKREMRKDAGVPATFLVRQLPPGPPVLPSPKQDELPWQAYQNERRVQEATAAKYNIIDPQSGYYKVPGSAASGQVAVDETEAYFRGKAQWESNNGSYTSPETGVTTGGIGSTSANARFGTNGSSASPAVRPGDMRELGSGQSRSDSHQQ